MVCDHGVCVSTAFPHSYMPVCLSICQCTHSASTLDGQPSSGGKGFESKKRYRRDSPQVLMNIANIHDDEGVAPQTRRTAHRLRRSLPRPHRGQQEWLASCDGLVLTASAKVGKHHTHQLDSQQTLTITHKSHTPSHTRPSHLDSKSCTTCSDHRHIISSTSSIHHQYINTSSMRIITASSLSAT